MANDLNDLKREISRAQCTADEAERLVNALNTLAQAAGVRTGWSDPEPRGLSLAFTEVVMALHGENISREAVRIAAMTVVNADMEEAEELYG